MSLTEGGGPQDVGWGHTFPSGERGALCALSPLAKGTFESCWDSSSLSLAQYLKLLFLLLLL